MLENSFWELDMLSTILKTTYTLLPVVVVVVALPDSIHILVSSSPHNDKNTLVSTRFNNFCLF